MRRRSAVQRSAARTPVAAACRRRVPRVRAPTPAHIRARGGARRRALTLAMLTRLLDAGVPGEHAVSLALLQVHDAAVLMERTRASERPCAFVNAALVADVFSVLVAAATAVAADVAQRKTTRSVGTELLFSLSAGRNISRALQTFGLNASVKHALLIVFHADVAAAATAAAESPKTGASPIDAAGASAAAFVASVTAGGCAVERSLDDLALVRDAGAIRAYYAITDAELACKSPGDAVAARIAVRECQ